MIIKIICVDLNFVSYRILICCNISYYIYGYVLWSMSVVIHLATKDQPFFKLYSDETFVCYKPAHKVKSQRFFMLFKI